MTVPQQLPLPDQLWRCDVCRGSGMETDPERQVFVKCRVCGGEGTVPYEPPKPGESPFAGLDAA